jgi:flagellar biosynthesis component FlhA
MDELDRLIKQNQKAAAAWLLIGVAAIIFVPVSPWDVLDVVLTIIGSVSLFISGACGGIASALMKMNGEL